MAWACIAVLAALASAVGTEARMGTEATVFYANGTYRLAQGIDQSGLAYGSFDALSNKTGWGLLDIVANSALKMRHHRVDTAKQDGDRAYFAAGYLEAALTCNEIAFFSSNSDDIAQDTKIASWLADNLKFVRLQGASNSSDYWVAVNRVLHQFDGIVAGYQEQCMGMHGAPYLSEAQIYWMQADGDLGDLQNAFGSAAGHRKRKQSNTSQPLSSRQRCSSLVKLLPDYSDIYFGHATWDDYSFLAPRIFKSYSLPVQRNGYVVLHLTTFSGSPAWLASMDDYYLTNGTSQLAVMETSYGIDDNTRYKHLTPASVLCWMRVIVANQLATDGKVRFEGLRL
jgi:hypothetical protein